MLPPGAPSGSFVDAQISPIPAASARCPTKKQPWATVDAPDALDAASERTRFAELPETQDNLHTHRPKKHAHSDRELDPGTVKPPRARHPMNRFRLPHPALQDHAVSLQQRDAAPALRPAPAPTVAPGSALVLAISLSLSLSLSLLPPCPLHQIHTALPARSGQTAPPMAPTRNLHPPATATTTPSTPTTPQSSHPRPRMQSQTAHPPSRAPTPSTCRKPRPSGTAPRRRGTSAPSTARASWA